ncbi:MAG TPA: MFS transporter [Micromonosporaceae bacterium]|nr:MFS transporter [Micromonosporaceae bacterium]
MRLDPYRRVLAIAGLRPLLVAAVLARVPVTMTAVTLTLHVVLNLDRGYGAAGLVAAAATVGSALGGPLLGRLVDRRGLRLVLAITTVAEATFWGCAPLLPYPALLGFALLGGLLTLPVFSVVRQSLAALVPADQRRPAYALDSMLVEVSFMVGPALAVLLVTTLSAGTTMWIIGAAMVAAGSTLYLLNPRVRTTQEEAEHAGPLRRREWLRPELIAMLLIAFATTVVLGGTDVALVAAMRAADEVAWTGVVFAAWAGVSLVGGFVYGMIANPPRPVVLLGLLGLATVPIGLGHGWEMLILTIIPAGFLCAPTLTATTDVVSRLVPASARGEAMGWHGSAMTAGVACGAPLAGVVIDHSSPAWGFVAVGAVGLLVAVVFVPLLRRVARADEVPVTETHSTIDSSGEPRPVCTE